MIDRRASRTRGPPGRVVVVAYTDYAWDPRVRGEAEMLVSDGYIVHAVVLRPSTGRAPTVMNGVRVWEVPLVAERGGKGRYLYQYAMFFLLASLLLIRLRLRGKLDFVHVHSLPDFQVFAALPLRLAGAPILLDLHEALPEIIAARLHLQTTSCLWRIAAFAEQLSCRFADRVITANDAIRAVVIRRGTPPQKITTVYNAADVGSPRPSSDQLRQELLLPIAPTIVHAGGINPERDLPTLLKALTLLRCQPDLNLVIAGNGDRSYIERLRELCVSLGLGGRVHFVGRVEREQALGLMAESALGVVTLESNPLTQVCWPTRVAEFAAFGKLLVLPKLSFLEHYLGDAAFYYDPGDSQSLAAKIDEAMSTSRRNPIAAQRVLEIGRSFEPQRIHETFKTVCGLLGRMHEY